MPRTRVKICGITEPVSGQVALEQGADALGFVFAESPRQVTIKQAEAILDELPRPFEPVAVVRMILDDPFMDNFMGGKFRTIQMDAENTWHRDEHFGIFVWYVYRLGVPQSEQCLAERDTKLKQPMLVEGPRSGQGVKCDWSAAASLACQHRVILAGGLTPDNVADAIRTVRPYGVDVSSGVESSLGKKDPIKIRDFLQAVRDVDRELQ